MNLHQILKVMAILMSFLSILTVSNNKTININTLSARSPSNKKNLRA
jgi:hypothetical protein